MTEILEKLLASIHSVEAFFINLRVALVNFNKLKELGCSDSILQARE